MPSLPERDLGSNRGGAGLRKLTPLGVAALSRGVLRQEEEPTPYDLALNGWSVIPVAPRSKKPLVGWKGFQDHPPSPEQVADWGRVHPTAGWAVILGRGLVCVDVDGPTAQCWCDAQGGLWRPGGPWCSTPTKRGWAYFFHVPRDVHDFRKVVPWMSSERPGEKVEILGATHLHNIPPSVGEDGRSYVWQRRPNLAEPIPLAPTWVLGLIRGDYSPAPVFPLGLTSAEREAPAGGVASISYRILATPVAPLRKAKRSPRVDVFVALLERQDVAAGFMHLCGREGVKIGKAFCCVLPGHTDRHPSAALYKPPGKPFVLHDFHATTQDMEWWLLPDVLAAVRTGDARKLSSGERAVWLLRGLAELGRVTLPTIVAPPLPDDAPGSARKLYGGLSLLLAVRELYEPGQAERGCPFSWSFAAGWCGIGSPATVGKGMRWLFDRGFLRVTAPGSSIGQGGKRRAALIAIGNPNRSGSAVLGEERCKRAVTIGC